jgi:anti-sigma factor RsiW
MAPAPTDVPSSDHHTVKPWFNGKLAFAPVVPDLGSEGFPLVGARVDVVRLEPAATLVYSRGKHLISLSEIPGGQASAAPARRHDERGFLARTWTQGGVTYFAVSDAAVEELEAFVKLFRAEVARTADPVQWRSRRIDAVPLGFGPVVPYTQNENSWGPALRRMF